MAQAAAFRVTVGDPSATAASALGMVDFANPSASRLIAKPRGDISHGGGRRIAPGSPEEQALVTWIGLVTAPECQGGNGGSGGGGGGGGGGGSTGADLYATNCASCHGADARGLDGRPDIHCHRDIRDAVRNGRTGGVLGDMPAFPSIAEQDVSEIQAFLAGLCPTDAATGAELYASNCAVCHGSDAAGIGNAPSVRCALRVDDALTLGRGARMPAFPTFTSVERERIGVFLSERCDAAGRTGADLYAGNCASCHGSAGSGGMNGLGVSGPDIRCTEAGDYREKVRFGGDGMPAFPSMDASDVTAIQVLVQASLCSDD
jgi:mono/diheme cytochrome c family protein